MLRCSLRFLGAGAPKVTHIPDKLLINGKFVPAVSGKTFEVTDPATEEVIAHVAEADAADVDIAVKAARDAFETYRFVDGSTRRDLMNRLANLLEKNSKEVAALESLDNGKPYSVALAADVELAVRCLRYYAGHADKIYGDVVPVDGNNFAVTRRQPVGVCGQIVPWNFPLLMAAWKIGPALCTGNTIVLKPAEQTPLTALRLGELALEAGYPAGVFNVLPGFGATAGAAIAQHMDVDKIAFTGSTVVGREIMRMAATSNIKKCSLELGGKSALIVAEDADPVAAAKVASQGIYFNAGQVCTASSRIYCHESLHDAFVAELSKHAEGQRLGPGCSAETTMGPLVSRRQHERVLEYIRVGKEEGATVATGGERVGERGYFVKPTILTNVREDSRVAKEEIFGPVTCVMKFKSIDEVVRRANDSEYGLAAGICTKNVNTALRYSSMLDAGTVWINTWNSFDAAMPFGGFKQSGIGRELGRDALELYTEAKSVYFALDGPITKN